MRRKIHLNEAEHEALHGLRPEAWPLYGHLRSRMDYATGVVGLRAGNAISWEALREALYQAPGRGVVDSGMPRRAKVERVVGVLERAGLLERLNNPRGTIAFRCVLATTDQSASNKPKQNPASFEALKTTPYSAEPPKPEQHPVTGFTTTSNEVVAAAPARESAGANALSFARIKQALCAAGLSHRMVMHSKSRDEIRRWLAEGITPDELQALAREASELRAAGEQDVGPLMLGQTFTRMRQPADTRQPLTLAAYIEQCQQAGRKPLPADCGAAVYAQRIGLPRDFYSLAWAVFKDRHLRQTDKKSTDWCDMFHRALEGDWMRLWRVTDDGYRLTTAGEQAERWMRKQEVAHG
ncbi:MAG: hypothetical protein ABF271_12745 [Abyssibacter sp.]|uniref:hypothetical protein n=1 Tax=Abyssibacter sp. TaxID=2320200 RepID=UPI00321BD193